MSSGVYPALTNFFSLPQITETELIDTMTILLNNGLSGNQYTTLKILVEWINQNWSNVENLPPLEISDLTVFPPVRKYVTYNILEAAFNALKINFTVEQNTELMNHVSDYNNPHEVTAAAIGLNFVEDYPIATQADIGAVPPPICYLTFDMLTSALDSFGLGVLRTLTLVPNYPPFNPSAPIVGQGATLLTYQDLQQALVDSQTFNNGNILTATQISQLQSHLDNYSNPHKVTAVEVGLGLVPDLPPTYTTDIQTKDFSQSLLTYALLAAALNSLPNLPSQFTLAQINALVGHLIDYTNPHQLSASLIGLDKMANYGLTQPSDIIAVKNGANPPQTYVTYAQLKEAAKALGCCSGAAVYISPYKNLTLALAGGAATGSTIDLIATISNPNNANLTDTEIYFTYGNGQKTTPQPYSGSDTIDYTLSGLTQTTTYSITATLIDTTISSVDVVSNTINATTLTPALPTLVISSPTQTSTSASLTAVISNPGGYDLTGSEVVFSYYVSTTPSTIITLPALAYNGSLTLTTSMSSLTSGDTYVVSAVLQDSNTKLKVNSNIINVSPTLTNSIFVYIPAIWEAALTSYTGNPGFSANTWNMIGVVNDGSGILKLYCNGVINGDLGSSADSAYNPSPISLVGNFGTGSTLSSNAIVTNTALSATEIANMYNNGINMTSFTDYENSIKALSGLVGYWPMNETSGLTAFDLSGNNNNGTYTSAPVSSPNKLLGNPSIPAGGTSAYTYMSLPTNNIQLVAPYSIFIWSNMSEAELISGASLYPISIGVLSVYNGAIGVGIVPN
jgi:hypothetical protein